MITCSERAVVYTRRPIAPHPEDVIDVVHAAFQAVNEDGRVFDGADRLDRPEELSGLPGDLSSTIDEPRRGVG
jgi:hypothetical protein